MGNRYILAIVDEFTKFATLYACQTVEAKEYVDALIKHIATFGLAEQIRTDGGSQFTATICDEIYRGSLSVMEKVRDDIYRCRDIISGKILTFHVERLREFKVSPSIMPSELIEWAAVDKDEFLVESIIEHRGSGRSGDPLSFQIRWEGYGPEDDSWLPYREVKDLSALDEYESRFPDVLRYVKIRGSK